MTDLFESRFRGLAAACLVALVACGDGATGPGGAGIPNLVGVYAGTWNTEISVPSTGQVLEITCPGSALISTQDSDGVFTGTWTQVGTSECTAAFGALGGRVTAGGDLTITEFTNVTSPTLEESTGGSCQYLPGSNGFTGTATESRFELDREAEADCAGTRVIYRWTLAATR